MVPYGKFNWKQVTQDGEIHTKCPDGLYVGVQDGYRVRIVYCPTKQAIGDFKENSKPEKVPKKKRPGIAGLFCGIT